MPPEALVWDGLAQDKESLFGRILRIDVDRGFPGYAIPRDNPFTSSGGRRELWAWGFRNPYRIAFDRAGGGFFVTAVAETLWEAAYQVRTPVNYGWPLMEGTHCVDRLKLRQPPASCPSQGASGEPIELPVFEYANMQASHPETKLGIAGVGTAITGARMYRGRAIPMFAGQLIVSDWSADFRKPSGQIFVAAPIAASGQVWPYRRALRVDSRSGSRVAEVHRLARPAQSSRADTAHSWRRSAMRCIGSGVTRLAVAAKRGSCTPEEPDDSRWSGGGPPDHGREPGEERVGEAGTRASLRQEESGQKEWVAGQLHDPDLAVPTEPAHHHPAGLQAGPVPWVDAVAAVVVLGAGGGTVERGGPRPRQDGHRLFGPHEGAGERDDRETLRARVRLGMVGVLDPENVARELDDRVLEPPSGAHEGHAALASVADGAEGAVHVPVRTGGRHEDSGVAG